MLHLMLANGRAVRMPARLPMPLGMHATGTADMGGEPSLPAVVMTTNINYNHGDDSLDLERSIADELAAIDFGALPELVRRPRHTPTANLSKLLWGARRPIRLPFSTLRVPSRFQHRFEPC